MANSKIQKKTHVRLFLYLLFGYNRFTTGSHHKSCRYPPALRKWISSSPLVVVSMAKTHANLAAR